MKENNKSKIITYFVLFGLLSFLSIKIKDFILSRIADIGEISTPLLSFYEVHNTGAAFNLFTGKVNVLIVSAVIFIIIIIAMVFVKSHKFNNNMIYALSLLSCGMSLNTFERIELGYVVDYMYFTFFKSFPVFNIPDIMIVVGAFMLAFSIASKKRIAHE